MRDSSEYGARLRRLYNRLQRAGPKLVEPEPHDVTTELVLACLSTHTTEAKARTALNKLRSNFVDFNELRVCRTSEVVEVLGKNFTHAREVSEQLLGLLKGIFDKQDSLDIEHLKGMGKRDAKIFLESLDEATSYLVARVMLRGLGAHAFPVHEQMLRMLREEEVVDAAADAAAVQGFLERQMSANRISKAYALLRRHADNLKGTRARVAKRASKPAKESKDKVKRPVKKPPSKTADRKKT